MKHFPPSLIPGNCVKICFLQESESQKEQENQTAGKEEKEGRGDNKIEKYRKNINLIKNNRKLHNCVNTWKVGLYLKKFHQIEIKI